MIRLTFDKNTEKEKSINLISFFERISPATFSGSWSKVIEKQEDVPVIEVFDDLTFETVEAVNSDGIVLPLVNRYNAITELSVAYDDALKRYNINIVLSWVEEEK